MKKLAILILATFMASLSIQAQNHFGNGNDGDLTIYAGETITINTERTTVAGINYTGSPSIIVDSTGGIAAGDEILIISMQDPETDMEQNTVGTRETHYVTSVGTNVFYLDLPLENGWGDLIQWALDSNGVPALEIAYTNKPEPEYKHKLFRSSWRQFGSVGNRVNQSNKFLGMIIPSL